MRTQRSRLRIEPRTPSASPRVPWSVQRLANMAEFRATLQRTYGNQGVRRLVAGVATRRTGVSVQRMPRFDAWCVQVQWERADDSETRLAMSSFVSNIY